MYQPKSGLNSPASIVSKVPRRSKAVELGRVQPEQQVRELPRNLAVPKWLKSIMAAQQGAKIVFITILGTIPIVYGYTVYTQNLWKNQHGQLNRYNTREQQQLVVTENLKYQIAETAEQSKSGMVAPTPDRMVFVSGAAPRPLKQRSKAPVAKGMDSQTPQGY